MTALASGRPTAADFRANNRGGGLFTETVNQLAASYLSLAAQRLGLAPTVLTLLNLVIGLGTSAAVAALAPSMRDGRVPAVLVGLLALLAWQVAYSLDCADGQLARTTGRTSAAGARVDVLCDVASQIALVTAVSAVAARYSPDAPAWLSAAFAASWMVNLVTSVLQQGQSAASLVSSRSLPVRVVKLARDYGSVVTAVALVIAFAPSWTVWLQVAFLAVNGVFLALSIASAGRASLR